MSGYDQALAEAADALADALCSRGWVVGFAAVVPADGLLVVRISEPAPDLLAAIAELSTAPVRIDVAEDGCHIVAPPPDPAVKPIRVLSVLEAIRRRPEMYYGQARPHQMPLLMLVMASKCLLEPPTPGSELTLEINLRPDGSFTVSDDGPGLPAAPLTQLRRPQVEELMTTMYAGRGPRGAGLAIVTAFADRAEVRTFWNGAGYRQVFDASGAISELEQLPSLDSLEQRLRSPRALPLWG